MWRGSSHTPLLIQRNRSVRHLSLGCNLLRSAPCRKTRQSPKTHTAGPAPSARPSACLSNLRRLTALLQLWLTDCVFTGVHCRGEQRRGRRRKRKRRAEKNLPGERRAANVNDGKTKKQRRLRWGRAIGWTQGQVDNKTKHLKEEEKKKQQRSFVSSSLPSGPPAKGRWSSLWDRRTGSSFSPIAMDTSTRKFTVRRWFSIYLKSKAARNKNSTGFCQLEVSRPPSHPPCLPPCLPRRRGANFTIKLTWCNPPCHHAQMRVCEYLCVKAWRVASELHHVCMNMKAPPPLGKRYRNGMWERLCVIWVFVYLFIYLLVVECFQESLQHRYSCCSACLSGIQKAEGGMGGRDDTVFWLRQKERGGRERDGGGLHGNTIRQTGDARRQTSKQGRQVDR